MSFDIITKFNKIFKISGITITKMDSDQTGGVFFSIKIAAPEIPIFFIVSGVCLATTSDCYRGPWPLVACSWESYGGFGQAVAKLRQPLVC